ncbi:hypothetical protein CAPTEDRAFT_212547 [Capitella teleta]|uniref:G-protein coupled receptors family 1 profile domain-containing protein n=1 Tax=Capitella teleta TaxID=283909 RepID=R7TDP7_CAPTE|nr:hypothetical protein CAPTEDRAFT_212547 [Capitella teleta]|eukprot:ELT91637.1 hypothetical protein CAPTEDRAFT_212547 [Capitella teleta]
MDDVTNTSAVYEDARTDNWTTESTVIASGTVPWMASLRYVSQVGVALPIAVLGIIGNLLAFIVLCRYKQKSTTRVLLQGLAVADAFNLLLAIVIRSLRYVIPGYNRHPFFIYMFHYFYPTAYILRLTGTWLTVLLTVDRFIAVRFPLDAQRLCTLRRTYSLMALTVLLSSLYCIPRFFEYRLVRHPSAPGSVGILPTAFQANKVYTLWYRIVFSLFIMYLLPMVLLIVLNSLLLCTLRRASSSREVLQQKYLQVNHSDRRQTAASQPPNINRSVTVIVVIVVLVSIVCNVTALVTHVLWSMSTSFDNMDHLEDARRAMSNINNVIINFNSAINFLIYCFCSKNFRAVFKRTFSVPEQCAHVWRILKKRRHFRQESRNSSTSCVSLPAHRLSSNFLPRKSTSLATSTNNDDPLQKETTFNCSSPHRNPPQG